MMDDVYASIVKDAMNSIFSRSPIRFQLDVTSHLLKMMSGAIASEPVLMVQPTGSGKSTVPLTAATIDGGITIIIENTLALGSDQCVKVNRLVSSCELKNIQSYHLDAIVGHELIAHIANGIIRHCEVNNDTSFVIFTSPESLLKKQWIKFIDTILDRKFMRLLCIDEIHLYVSYGCSFRKRFQLLLEKLFSKIKLSDNTSSIPILLMTATFNNQLLRMLEKMIGINVSHRNMFWADTKNFQKRHINISLLYSVQQYNKAKTQLEQNLKDKPTHKAIVITNVANKASQCQESIDSWLDIENKIKGDTILIIGDQEAELKFAYTSLFTNEDYDARVSATENILRPRILIGTSGCIGAGLDCSNVHYIYRFGNPPSIIDFIQEMGRCGRNTHRQADVDTFDCFSLSLYER